MPDKEREPELDVVVLPNGIATKIRGSLDRTFNEFTALRDAEVAWNAEWAKDGDEQDVTTLFQYVGILIDQPEYALSELTVFHAMRLWRSASNALQAADAALLAELGVEPGELLAPTDS